MRLRTSEQEQRVKWSVEGWQRMNFVTATLAEEEHDPKVISKRWTAFVKALKRRHYPQLRSIRVLQKHPGGHGWHIHALLDRFIPSQIMLELAAECGLGRMDFKMVSGEARERSVAYVVRYICRDMKGRWKIPALKGVRLLTASGARFKGEHWWRRFRDLVITDTGQLSRRLLQNMLEIRHAGNAAFKTRRGQTSPLQMGQLLCVATAQDVEAWQRAVEERRPGWLAMCGV